MVNGESFFLEISLSGLKISEVNIFWTLLVQIHISHDITSMLILTEDDIWKEQQKY